MKYFSISSISFSEPLCIYMHEALQQLGRIQNCMAFATYIELFQITSRQNADFIVPDFAAYAFCQQCLGHQQYSSEINSDQDSSAHQDDGLLITTRRCNRCGHIYIGTWHVWLPRVPKLISCSSPRLQTHMSGQRFCVLNLSRQAGASVYSFD